MGNSEACGSQANFGQAARTGSDNGPRACGELLQEFGSARKRHHAIGIFDFATLDFAVFCYVIGVREEVANRAQARTAVGAADDFDGVETMFVGPTAPDTGDSGSGVDEDAVEVEEDGLAGDFGHLLILAAVHADVGITPHTWFGSFARWPSYCASASASQGTLRLLRELRPRR